MTHGASDVFLMELCVLHCLPCDINLKTFDTINAHLYSSKLRAIILSQAAIHGIPRWMLCNWLITVYYTCKWSPCNFSWNAVRNETKGSGMSITPVILMIFMTLFCTSGLMGWLLGHEKSIWPSLQPLVQFTSFNFWLVGPRALYQLGGPRPMGGGWSNPPVNPPLIQSTFFDWYVSLVNYTNWYFGFTRLRLYSVTPTLHCYRSHATV